MIRTGYESVIGMRSGPMFAKTAKMDGVVTSVTDKGILVKYKDGTEEGYPLGTLYGRAEGSVYPHTLVTPLRAGQKFTKDTYLTYNTKFFEPDPILPGGIIYKGSMMVRVALMEVPQTHEDSSSISEALSKRMMTTTTKEKTFVVDFKESISDVVKIGQKMRPEDNLMIIEDEITAMDDSFSENSLAILAERSKNAPKAGYVGYISDIEVFYHGDISNMSNSLKSLTVKSDRKKAEEAKSRNEPYASGYVDGEYTVDGKPLALNKAVIKIRINVPDDLSLGDKIIYGHQLKSVVGEVMPYSLRTASGDLIDAKIGAKSFAARIVDSLPSMGVRATVLDVTAQTAVKMYRS